MVQIEAAFSSLPQREREAVITHGAMMRAASLQQRLFLAQSKVRSYEEKHQTTLTQLNQQGLPEQADYEMHEDYVAWSHWAEVAEQCQKDLTILEKITSQGLVTGESDHAGS
jgi:hypothetical protein